MNRLAGLAFVASQLIAVSLIAQIGSSPQAPTRREAMQILDYGGPRITSGGNIVFQFPNYDISIGGTPEYAGQGNGTRRSNPNDPSSREQVSTRVIYKSPNGSWDGANFAINPNYNYSYANNFYRNRFINSGREHTEGELKRRGGNFGAPYEIWTARYEPPRLDDVMTEPSVDPYMRQGIGIVKSEETMERLYQARPSFVYSPTPLPPLQPTPTPSPEDQKDKQPKQLLWQLDHDVRSSSENWAIRQAESTARSRRKLRTRPVAPQEPKRLTPETDPDSSGAKP